ncbi:MAG: MBL fold metallo-hydrolase [Sphingomonas sp.]|jgi:metallo-beta-lactamase family protein|uniref:MBL fold metallo-hydrolase n=1 Tax=Sphingomonas sp. TaxID=28214 RepID=UPI0035659B13
MAIELAFHGAAGTVTGSCMELTIGERRILIDCGMFQGSRTLEALNHEQLPFDPAGLDAIVLTHAHLDHSGRLPLVTRLGSTAEIWCTPATSKLIDPLLQDAARLQEADVHRRNKRPDRAGLPPFKRLYDANDVKHTVRQTRPLEIGTWAVPVPGVLIRFWDACHILGSASVEIRADGQRLLFSGDIGDRAADNPFHGDDGEPFDHVVCESTYGDRDRAAVPVADRRAALAAIVTAAMARGGNLLIPAFALERTQVILADLVALFATGGLAPCPIYVDSPLAERMTRTYRASGGVDIDGTPSPFDDANVHFTQSTAQSRGLSGLSGAIIIAGSGMCTGGRIREHLARNISRPDSTILFVGYQVPGTLGSVIRGGAATVRISGNDFDVLAHVERLDAYSAHADRAGLLRWISACAPVRGGLFLTHGEAPALDRLALDASTIAGVSHIIIPALDERFALAPGAPPRRIAAPRKDAPELVAPLDWRNRYAAFTSSLERRLRQLPTNSAREQALLAADEALRRALEARSVRHAPTPQRTKTANADIVEAEAS